MSMKVTIIFLSAGQLISQSHDRLSPYSPGYPGDVIVPDVFVNRPPQAAAEKKHCKLHFPQMHNTMA